MNKKEDFYKRQTSLSEVGDKGQEQLSKSRVLVIGAGGLGCPVLEYIAAAGVGHIFICDFDTVDYTNLHRQVLYNPSHVDQLKAQVARTHLKKQNPYIEVHSIIQKFDLHFDLNQFDLVIDCSDNFETKFKAHDLCYKTQTPLIQGSIHKFEGQIQFFNFPTPHDIKTPCLRCLWPETPKRSCVQTCIEAGVLGVVPGVIGTLQANEAIKHLLGLNTLGTGETLIINLFDFSTQKIKWKKNAKCPLCSNKDISLTNFNYGSSEFELKKDALEKGDYIFINLTDREGKFPDGHIKASTDNLLEAISHLDTHEKILLVCYRGITSLKAAHLLHSKGYKNSYSLKGGISNL